MILLAEAKNNSYPYETRDFARSLERIEQGSKQIKRKSLFVINNLEDFFKVMHWDFDSNKNYYIKDIVIVNNHIGVGSNLYGVSIQDEKSLSAYFKKNTFGMIDVQNGISLNNKVHCILYNNYNEFKLNFDTYLTNTPCVFFIKKTPLKYDNHIIPLLTSNNKNLKIERARIGDVNNNIDLSNLKFEVRGEYEINENILKI